MVTVDFQRVPETEEIVACGRLLNKMGTTFVVVGEVNSGAGKALDEGTVICLENRSVVGRIEEVFGPVVSPHYIVRFGCVVDDAKYEGHVADAAAAAVVNDDAAAAGAVPSGGGGSTGGKEDHGGISDDDEVDSDDADVNADVNDDDAGSGGGDDDDEQPSSRGTKAKRRRGAGVAAAGAGVGTGRAAAASRAAPAAAAAGVKLLRAKKNSAYTRMLEDLSMEPGMQLFAVVGTIRYVEEVGGWCVGGWAAAA